MGIKCFLKACLFSACLAIVPINGYAQILTLQELSDQLREHKSLRADFEQHRMLQGFSKPIISKGTLLVVEGKGLIWHQHTPISVLYVINDEQVKSQVANNEPTIIDSKSNPQMFYFSSLLKSIMQADQKVLDETFDMNLTSDSDNWTLSLVPKVSPINKIFAHIELKGQSFVDSLILNDKQNDSTSLKFTNQHSDNIKLTEDEKNLLGL